MSGREGGKKKPLKAAKKANNELDDDDKVSCKDYQQHTGCKIYTSGLSSQAKRGTEEAERDGHQGCRKGTPGGRRNQKVRKEVKKKDQKQLLLILNHSP